MKFNGKENVTHEPAIEEEHFKSNSSKPGAFALSLSSPNVHFYIVLFCRRGCEGQRAQPPKVCPQFLEKATQILLTFEKRFYRQQFSFVVSLIASGSTFGDPVIDTTRTLMSN